MNAYDTERNRRLERADRHISRCPECGAWRWDYVCTSNHDAVTQAVDLVEVAA